MDYTAVAGETLCEIAIRNGFPDCKKLRDANPDLQDSTCLAGGEKVTIPDKEQNDFAKAVEKLWNFCRPNFPPPRVEFVFENGRGYGHDVNPTENRPQEDPTLERLAISNYVSDRGGDGKTAGDFPADNFYEYDEKGSKDPDHFKVQVYDNGCKADQVTVNLYALKPTYIRKDADGTTRIVRKPDPRDDTSTTLAGRILSAIERVLFGVKWHFVRPTAATRKLENVVCKRLGKTSYFRSPYLRLVSTEGSRAKRPTQCLLLGSYWDEATTTYEKRYTEILHQAVEAEYALANCPVHKCSSLKHADLNADRSLHMAFWIVKGTGITAEQIRATVYKWSRTTLAMAGIRPIIEQIQEVDIPKNMLCVANLTAAQRGRHASGATNDANTQSAMTFQVDGKQVTCNPRQGDSPSATADGIMAAISASADLAGYTCKKFEVNRSDLTAVPNEISNPFDVLVFKPDGKPAEITAPSSSDRPNSTTGKGGQTLSNVMAFTLDNFPIGWQPATDEQRILRWNFSKDNCINQFILGTPLVGAGGRWDGWAPYGPHAGWVADVGPVSYLAKTGVVRNFVILHEICHPCMHVCHTQAPKNDAAGETVELMNWCLSDNDNHDATKHLADAPIAAEYNIVEDNANKVVDGTTSTGPPHNTVTTPVRRLQEVGAEYGIVRTGQDPALDADISPNDVPAS